MARSPRISRPLDGVRLEEIALAYAARYATSRAKLEAYLRRKLRERGWDGESEPPVREIAERFVEAGYVDDAAFARARTGGLLRRGYGMRRVGQALAAAGIDKELAEELRPDEAHQRRAALALARKRGLGPFGMERPDRAARQKQIAAMLRAGHSFDQARALIDAPDIEAAELWVAEAGGESEWD
ncbi:MAG: RecX family transcriptional regulator [Novosphingobium sp.]|nr:RecX family transcriptional regulator [Novosphingobium sp.]